MIDWRDCPLVQANPGYMSGAPALRDDPRMTVDTFVECADEGMEPDEIAEVYNISSTTVRTILDYAAKHRVSPRPAGSEHPSSDRQAPISL